MFTSLEHVAYEGALMVQGGESHIIPFERDKLFLSIYDSCRHRPNAITDATALTDTVLATLIKHHVRNGLLQCDAIVAVTHKVLGQFDTASQVQYAAFHPPKKLS